MMDVKITTKLYVILILLLGTLFGSCVNNKDEPDPPPPPTRKPVTLDKTNLVGTWEVYYYTKRIIDDKDGRDTNYRYTEQDGFTVTFLENGKYYEKNVFGGKTIEGTYKLGKNDDSSTKNDQIELTFYVDSIKDYKTDYAYVPNLYEESFVFYNSYTGTAQKEDYKVSDVRYYRNKDKYPNYVDQDFKKVELTKELLMGEGPNKVWEFYRYDIRVDMDSYSAELGKNNTPHPYLNEAIEELGELYHFYEDDKTGQLMFLQINAKDPDIINMKDGIVLIHDDVINMKWEGWGYVVDDKGNPTPELEWKVETYKWWIKKINTTNGSIILQDYDEYRDFKDVLKDKAESAYYRQKEWKPSSLRGDTRSFRDIRSLEVKRVAD